MKTELNQARIIAYLIYPKTFQTSLTVSEADHLRSKEAGTFQDTLACEQLKNIITNTKLDTANMKSMTGCCILVYKSLTTLLY